MDQVVEAAEKHFKDFGRNCTRAKEFVQIENE
jgi:hypothetical protein